jgi:hypothetical protein
MSEYIDISLVIIGESTDDDLYRRIMLEVSKADDTIVSVFHPIGANTIEVSAHWNQSEFDEKIERIKKIPGVKDIKILNQRKAVQRHNFERIKISEEASWIKESEPLGVITRAKDSRNYYDALSLSCSFFQSFGQKILLWDSQKTGNPISNNKLKTVDSITCELYTRSLIDKMTYDKMNEVRQLRNDFQHDGLAFKLSSSQAQDAETKIIKALDCVETLITNYRNVT